MSILTRNLGYPRIGNKRELKRAIESFWKGKINETTLQEIAKEIRQQNWQTQASTGLTQIPSNDFSFYDQTLDTICLLGAIPERFNHNGNNISLETYFQMARGKISAEKCGCGKSETTALEMTKWFDTNYHYIVPEFDKYQSFKLASTKVIDEYNEAKAMNISTRPVLLGPVSFLLLGKTSPDSPTPLALMDNLLPVYVDVLQQLAEAGAEWVQIDEPFLVMNLSRKEKRTYKDAYQHLGASAPRPKLLVTTYFGTVGDSLALATSLPVNGLHLDLVRAPQQLDIVLKDIPDYMSLSLGLINGRNVWRANLDEALEVARKAVRTLGSNRVFISPSCSLLHCPIDIDNETEIEPEIRSWLAFAKQKIEEIVIISTGINKGKHSILGALQENRDMREARRTSPRVNNAAVSNRLAQVTPDMQARKSPFKERHKKQQQHLNLPPLPTTTIGSFPQTRDVRLARSRYDKGEINSEEYSNFIRNEIEKTIRFQEEIGLDVLVHGEFERNDMVQYFGEQLSGFVFTRNGWVQSYGSRYVRPPIIFGDVHRPKAMTVEWTQYAQSLTDHPVKGMLTGPVTILQWSFVRDDQPRPTTCRQIALAIRNEVQDLEAAGIAVIQIDEPALREGLPLRRAEWQEYLNWAVECFHLASSGVRDETQIHTHMSYSEFNDIIDSIAALDADVISIEASRSKMDLLDAFTDFQYPNEIGPGVYDIHSPRIPGQEEMEELLRKAMEVLSPGQIWVNPDCGLKTRGWNETIPAIENMVAAAKVLRAGVKR